MFKKVLVANRGEIACRIFKTLKRLGIGSVAVYSEADTRALHVEQADEAVCLGPAPAHASYLCPEKIVAACRKTGAEAVHPGYGFLSERADFRRLLDQEGLTFIGPPLEAIERMGDKIVSKRTANEAGVSTVPGSDGESEEEGAIAQARAIGYPVMIKASAGGGGKGMRIAWTDEEVREGFARARSEALSSFGDGRLFIEKYIQHPRHIEIQILGDRHGHLISLGERECSIQRRNQKVIEEAPSPFLHEDTRRRMEAQALALGQAVGYFSAGTVEFIVDRDQNFYFLEMNTRLQVEHPVTELVTGVDLVEEMVRVAQGLPLSVSQDEVTRRGWAIEARLYAENPRRGFLPSTGRLTRYRPPPSSSNPDITIREDTGVFEGDTLSVYYDPMMAKLITHGPDRGAAIEAMATALDAFEIRGVHHNLSFLSTLMDHPKFREGDFSTHFIADTFPEGFEGNEDRGGRYGRILEAVALFLDHKDNARRRAITGQIPGKKIVFNPVRMVHGLGPPRRAEIQGDTPSQITVAFEGEAPFFIEGDWTAGQSCFIGKVFGEKVCVQITPVPNGFHLSYRGYERTLHVYTPLEAAMLDKMPEKTTGVATRFAKCPMPGLVVRVCIEEGQQVELGDPLLVVEAMKMENIVRAERAGRVKTLLVKGGQSLAAEATILEFEGA